jgi:inner membrane protein
MDTITHTLFGLTLYGAAKQRAMDKPAKRALLFTTVIGSQIPDIDVISQWWDTEGMYQMWHRGLTHSIFLTPIWAFLIWLLCRWIWRERGHRLFSIGLLAVIIHNTSDLFNAWGTGYMEPFSSIRITFGTIPIVDLTVWGIMLIGYLVTRIWKLPGSKVYRVVWLCIALHFLIQSAQGFAIYTKVKDRYEQTALSASFVPGQFQVIGKHGGKVEISNASVWSEPKVVYELTSQVDIDLEGLFEANPKARTLYEWSPFVVIVDEDQNIGIYDPRFYRNGQSFLFEKAAKPLR